MRQRSSLLYSFVDDIKKNERENICDTCLYVCSTLPAHRETFELCLAYTQKDRPVRFRCSQPKLKQFQHAKSTTSAIFYLLISGVNVSTSWEGTCQEIHEFIINKLLFTTSHNLRLPFTTSLCLPMFLFITLHWCSLLYTLLFTTCEITRQNSKLSKFHHFSLLFICSVDRSACTSNKQSPAQEGWFGKDVLW